ncbi:MAG: helix-turn-helix domain-containing protein [Defluviitaleaceae bacterium]|nr:helix-turn-helix domain-containing protein [Defluviitaleaceae bacterium]
MDFFLLGKRIRDERLLMRLTIEQLAERIDKSGSYIGQIERGDGKPSIETLVDIANALGTTVDFLLTDSIRANDDNIMREINLLLFSIDDRGKRFILEMIKRYYHYHENNGNI